MSLIEGRAFFCLISTPRRHSWCDGHVPEELWSGLKLLLVRFSRGEDPRDLGALALMAGLRRTAPGQSLR
jgi:hypothetical protein